MTSVGVKKFRRKIYTHYHTHQRDFPWRPPSLKLRKDTTLNPYRILISEIMLQQTQAKRVVPYYQNFLKQFSTIHTLARADTRRLLTAWSGLGYNRRALYLRDMARIVCKKYKGRIPILEKELLSLPGIGPATGAAVRAFAWNLPSLYLDTNVRSVFLHEFFPRRRKVADTEILPLLEATLDRKNPRKWYYALLDYGASLKQYSKNPSRRSKHYTKQKPFKGSDRELRGKIIRLLLQKPHTRDALAKQTGALMTKLTQILHRMQKEGLIVSIGKSFSIHTI